jgi:predicted RNase H-like HicB family nuclease
MKVYHVKLDQEDGWYCATAMEDTAIFTQGRTLDEIIANVREVAELMYDETDVQVELVVPPGISLKTGRTNMSRRAAAKKPAPTKAKQRAKVA